MVSTESSNDVTAYISLVFIGLVLFILTVGCLCRMCRPVKKKLVVRVKQTHSADASAGNSSRAPTAETKSGDVENQA